MAKTAVKRLLNKVHIPIFETENEDGSGLVVFDYETPRTVQLFSALDGPHISTGITKFSGGYMQKENGEYVEKFLYEYELDKNFNAITDPVTGERKIKHYFKPDSDGNLTIKTPKILELNLMRNQALHLQIPQQKELLADLLNAPICGNRKVAVDGELIFPDKCLYFINDEISFAVTSKIDQSSKMEAWKHLSENFITSENVFKIAGACLVLDIEVDAQQLDPKNYPAYTFDLVSELTKYVNDGGYSEYRTRVVDNPSFSKECFLKLALKMNVIQHTEDGVYVTNVLGYGGKQITLGSSVEALWQKLAELPEVQKAISSKIHYEKKNISGVIFDGNEPKNDKKKAKETVGA